MKPAGRTSDVRWLSERVDNADELGMLVCMRTTLNIDDALLAAAMRATGIDSKTRIIEVALEALIQAAARERIAAMYGRAPKAKAPPRRRLGKRPA